MLIYLIKIPPAAATKGHLSRHKCAPLDIFPPLNSKDYLGDWRERCDGCGGSGERGLYWLVRIPPCRLSTLTAGQISSRRTIWPRDKSRLALSPRFHSRREECGGRWFRAGFGAMAEKIWKRALKVNGLGLRFRDFAGQRPFGRGARQNNEHRARPGAFLPLQASRNQL